MKNKVGRPKGSGYNINDYIGKKINRWTIIGFSHNKPGGQYWNAQCECGTISKIRVYPLLKGKSQGCRFCRPQSTPLQLPEKWNDSILFSVYYFRHLHYGAKSRKLEFSITPDYINELLIQQNSNCKLSGLPITVTKAVKNGKPDYSKNTASLDRIDSTKGYIPGNVQWIHKTINAMKMDIPENIFIDFCKKIAANSN